MSHSPEPWNTYEREWVYPGYSVKESEHGIKDANDSIVCVESRTEHDASQGPSEEDCRRIVACINFCREFSTEFLEKHRLDSGVVTTEDGDLCYLPARIVKLEVQ